MRGLRPSPRLAAALVTALLWALLAGSALFWWLRAAQLAAPVQAPLAGGVRATAAIDSAQVARALGATDAAPAAASAAAAPDLAARLALRGVVTHGGRGAALIAVDGKPALPLRVGARLEGIEGDWRLRSVAPHAVVLVADGRELRLEMPPLAQRSSAGDAVAPRPPTATPLLPGMGQPQPPGVLGGTPLPGPTRSPVMPPGAPPAVAPQPFVPATPAARD